MNKKTKILHFLLLDIHMCIDIKYLKKVFLIALTEKMPNAPKYLVGLLNLSGKSIPIIDLAMRLGLQRKVPYSLDMPILLCSDSQCVVGFVVDKILGLNEIEIKNIQSTNDFNQSSSVLGVIAIGTDLALILNISDLVRVNTKVKESFLEANKLMDTLNSDEQSNYRKE